ncbi:MAG: MopE-related protein [Sandaracinus sp.]
MVALPLAGCDGGSSTSGDAGRVDGSPDAALVACATDLDCEDGLFCNGASTCAGGHCTPGVRVCDDGIACTNDFCSEERRTCLSTPPDEDGDGVPTRDCVDALGTALGTDCDDHDPDRFPGNPERCDTHDEDCDPTTVGGVDMDLDGTLPSYCCNPSPTAGAPAVCGLDCDDTMPNISRLATEICDMRDNDCDGNTDENVMVMSWPDADGDGWGDATATPEVGCTVASFAASAGGDCADDDDAIHPRVPDRCNGVDDDCDGNVDENGTVLCGTHLDTSTVECIAGRCVTTGCSGTTIDCNEDGADGCEVDVCGDPSHCGSCARDCGTHVSGYCRAGACGLSGIAPVQGTVVDAITGAPIAGAHVQSVGYCPVLDAITDAAGHYSWNTTGTQLEFVRITATGYPTHVNPYTATTSIFPRSLVDAWRADPDAATPDAPNRAILVADSLSDVGAMHDSHVRGSNASMGGDLLPMPIGGQRVVFMGVVPGFVRTGGGYELGGGCEAYCSPELRVWMEAGAVTHVGSYFCAFAC